MLVFDLQRRQRSAERCAHAHAAAALSENRVLERPHENARV
jgi:hypothetical protein